MRGSCEGVWSAEWLARSHQLPRAPPRWRRTGQVAAGDLGRACRPLGGMRDGHNEAQKAQRPDMGAGHEGQAGHGLATGFNNG
jgi:hypothetical protein